MRYFPDLTWETANDIVETAFVNDIALVRIVNSVVRKMLNTLLLHICIRISNVSRTFSAYFPDRGKARG